MKATKCGNEWLVEFNSDDVERVTGTLLLVSSLVGGARMQVGAIGALVEVSQGLQDADPSMVSALYEDAKKWLDEMKWTRAESGSAKVALLRRGESLVSCDIGLADEIQDKLNA